MGRDAQHHNGSRHPPANVSGWRRARGQAGIQPRYGESDDLRPERELKAPWGLGWALGRSRSWNAFGDLVSGEAFGHAGATGTVAWADPETQVLCVILTNRPYSLDDGRFLRLVSNAVAASVQQVPREHRATPHEVRLLSFFLLLLMALAPMGDRWEGESSRRACPPATCRQQC